MKQERKKNTIKVSDCLLNIYTFYKP